MAIQLDQPTRTGEGFLLPVKPGENSWKLVWLGSNYENLDGFGRSLKRAWAQVSDQLYEKRNSWFTQSPTRQALQRLASGWTAIDLPVPQGSMIGDVDAILESVFIDSQGIKPKWKIVYTPRTENRIHLPPGSNDDDDCRDVQVTEIPEDNDQPIRILSPEEREYYEQKFASKERVKEARLKAQLARRQAEDEMQNFFENYEVEDGESTFSDYDLSDSESNLDSLVDNAGLA